VKGAQAPRGEGHVGFERAFELEERLIVERDIVDIVEGCAGFLEAIGERARESVHRVSCG